MKTQKHMMLLVSLSTIVMMLLAACGSAATPAATTAPANPTMAMPGGTMSPKEPMAPSNGNKTPGAAITQNLKGDAANGAKVFVDNCQKCHGENGVGGVANPGSDDGTIPSLNPVDEDMGNDDPQLFATTLDLFIEHGSTAAGPNPQQKMPAWGDEAKLNPQQIADVIAYVISLNTK